MHVLGMDDVHPAPDRMTAQRWAAEWTVFWNRERPEPREGDPIMSFVVAPWPGSADAHAAGLDRSIHDNEFRVSPLLGLGEAQAIVEDGRFLADRLTELDGASADPQQFLNEFYGHVQPALARFATALSKADTGREG